MRGSGCDVPRENEEWKRKGARESSPEGSIVASSRCRSSRKKDAKGILSTLAECPADRVCIGTPLASECTLTFRELSSFKRGTREQQRSEFTGSLSSNRARPLPSFTDTLYVKLLYIRRVTRDETGQLYARASILYFRWKTV